MKMKTFSKRAKKRAENHYKFERRNDHLIKKANNKGLYSPVN